MIPLVGPRDRWAPLLAGVLLLCGARQVPPAPAPAPPDVLIVLADDLSWPELRDAPTPAIDALAREGVTLASFFGMPICSPARQALLFGAWPRRSGLCRNVNSYAPPSAENPVPPPGLVSLPELLAGRGYHTALVGKWHLGQAAARAGADPMLTAPEAHGFQRWLAGAPANLRAGEGTGYRKWLRVDDGEQRMEERYATLAMRDAALAWWGETPSPKFLLVSLAAPHQPLSTPAEELLPEGFQVGSGADERFLAMIASVDHVVGRLRAAVDPQRTLFFFLSDNGTAPTVYGVKRREGKGTTRERGIHVPFLAAGSGLARGQSTDALVSIVDVMATVAEATGAPFPPTGGGGEDSLSFLGALVRPESWEPPRPWVLSEKYDEEGDDLALRTPRWKLRRLDGRELLIDLVRDPQELAPRPTDGELGEEERQALGLLRGILEREVPPRKSGN